MMPDIIKAKDFENKIILDCIKGIKHDSERILVEARKLKAKISIKIDKTVVKGKVNDYILTDNHGSKYVCSSKILKNIYEQLIGKRI